jgi:hypothetical protein
LQFATKDDLLKFATKDDLVAFKDEIIKNFRILSDDAKDSTKKAEGFKATLDRIERDLGEMKKSMGEKFADHGKVLANRNARLVTLETRRRR